MPQLLDCWRGTFRESEQQGTDVFEFLLDTNQLLIRISALTAGSFEGELGQVPVCQQAQGLVHEPTTKLLDHPILDDVAGLAFT